MLFMPSAVLIGCTALGLLLVMRAWKRGRAPRQAPLGCLLAFAGAIGLYMASTPIAARAVIQLTESGFGPVDPASLPKADAIVVLGGGMGATVGEDGIVHLYARGAPDRFETALRAWRAGRAPVIAFGGGAPNVPCAPTEGAWNRMRAWERGVPTEATLAGPAAQYTTDESDGLVRALKERGATKIILCTSATHMRRAMRIYRLHGLEIIPLPCDFLTRGTAEVFSWGGFIPRGEALAHIDLCAKEWLGRLSVWLTRG
jgi:uncharacterized SAM-binding protein YcdF (DUF218 family)